MDACAFVHCPGNEVGSMKNGDGRSMWRLSRRFLIVAGEPFKPGNFTQIENHGSKTIYNAQCTVCYPGPRTAPKSSDHSFHPLQMLSSIPMPYVIRAWWTSSTGQQADLESSSPPPSWKLVAATDRKDASQWLYALVMASPKKISPDGHF